MSMPLPPLPSALPAPSRLRILSALRSQELCACHLIELLALAPSTISKHMDILRSAGLVLARRDGKWMHYRLPDKDAAPLVRHALAFFFRAFEFDDESRAQAAADSRRLKAILKLNPEALCCTQRKSGPAAPSNKAKGRPTPTCAPGSCSCAPATPAARRWPKASPAASRQT